MASFSSALTIDADYTEYGWEIVFSFDVESAESGWTGISDSQLPEIVGWRLAQLLIAERDSTLDHRSNTN